MERILVDGVGLEVVHIMAPDGAPACSPIVFLHEGLGSVAMWRDWPAQVCAAAGRSGIVVSRRGYGRSDPVPDVRGRGRLAPDYLHREAFEVLPHLLTALGVNRPVLLGHSDGGTIALLHASRHPVEACIVMAPHLFVEDKALRAIGQARDAYAHGDLRRGLARYHDDPDGAFWQWNDVWLGDGFRAFDIEADCARITAPVLAIQGVDDAYGTMAQIDRIATAGYVRREKLAGCGHSPHRDRPEAVASLVAGFLAATGRI